MSFSSSVKKELSSIDLIPDCCLHAQAYGLVLFAHFSAFDISVTTENEDTAAMYARSLAEECGVNVTQDDGEGVKKTFFVPGTPNKNKVFECFGHSPNDIALRIIRSNLSEDCCVGSFLRGAFMACGTVTDPNKQYHLEFVVSHKKLCNDLIDLLSEHGLNPKYVLRKGYHIVYFKESENIEDLLTMMGATESSLQLMGIKMEKDVINRVNRRVNFEMSNINKTIDAAGRQAAAIAKIEETVGIDSLPENLREVARLRLENPDISLSDLGHLLGDSLSRSGLNHRLSRLMSIADDLDNRE